MKKILSFLMVALFSASMWADCYIAGSWTNWGTGKVQMDYLSGSYMVKTINFAEADYHEFKVVDGDNWLGLAGPSTMGSTGLAWNISTSGSSNIGINHQTVGDYLFIYDYNAKTVSVIWPDVSIIAAGSEAIFGSNWRGDDVNNKLTTTDGYTYTLIKKDVEVASGDYQFKVVVDNDWTNYAYPGSNKDLKLEKSGFYDITITFNVLTREVTVESTLTKEKVILPTIQLGGEWYTNEKGEWLAGTAFEPAEGDKTASTTIHFDTPKDYGFKVVVNGSWQSKPKDEKGNLYRFHRKWAGDKNFSASNADAMILEIDKAGDYTFIWTFENDSLSIIYPDLEKSVVTIAAPAHGAITVKNGEADVNDGDKVEELSTLTLTLSDNTEGYIFSNLRAYLTDKPDSAIAITAGALKMPGAALTITADETARRLANGFYLIVTSESTDVASIKAANLFGEEDGEGQRTLTTALIKDWKIKVVEVKDDAIVGWYPNGTGNDYLIDENHAGASKTIYFSQTDHHAEGWHYDHIFIAANDPTGVENTAVEGKSIKTLQNGMLIIEKNGVRYTVLGQEVR